MDDATMPQRPGRVISFERFLQRNTGSRQAADGSTAGSPFGGSSAARLLTQRQITHRKAMLRHMQRGAEPPSRSDFSAIVFGFNSMRAPGDRGPE
jgi:hypothetical protein